MLLVMIGRGSFYYVAIYGVQAKDTPSTYSDYPFMVVQLSQDEKGDLPTSMVGENGGIIRRSLSLVSIPMKIGVRETHRLEDVQIMAQVTKMPGARYG